jgi:hypothetical protein
MNGYQFIASLFQSLVSLAWPAAFIGAVWLFRERLTALLPLLHLKYKDFDISFRLDKAEMEAQALGQPQDDQAPQPTPEETSNFLKLVELSPRAAILERRLELENAVEEFAESVGMKPSRPRSLLNLTRELRKHELIDQTTSALLDDLRIIGNTAAHAIDTHISVEDALRFYDLTEKVIRQFRISTDAARLHRPPSS